MLIECNDEKIDSQRIPRVTMQDKLSIVAQRNGQKLLQQWPKGDYREVDETTGKNCWNGGVKLC